MQQKNPFILASLILGIASLTLLCTGVLPLPLGALGILFAVLSCRKGRRMDPMAVAGITTSLAGIVCSGAILAYTLVNIPALMRDTAYRSQLNAIYEQLYGESFDEFMEQYYGVDVDALFGAPQESQKGN